MNRILPRTITVMLGGSSAEREVSLRTGAAVARALRSLGHTVLEFDPSRSDGMIPSQTEVVFLALHGTQGEDGTIQRRLEEWGVPYTGCGPEASRISFDKLLTKERCLRAGIRTPRHLVVDNPHSPWPAHWTPPLVLKPACQGSSVGLHFVEDPSDWPAALRGAFQHDWRVLVEERIRGRETTVGILEETPLPVVEIRPRRGAYDYQNKYTSGATDYLVPAPFPDAVTRSIQEAGIGAFAAVGGRDYGRVDVMVDENHTPWVLEVNTLPGMTETSLLPKAAAAAGIAYAELCQKMIDLAMARAKAGAVTPRGAILGLGG